MAIQKNGTKFWRLEIHKVLLMLAWSSVDFVTTKSGDWKSIKFFIHTAIQKNKTHFICC